MDRFLLDSEKAFKHTLVYVFVFYYTLKMGEKISCFNLVTFVQKEINALRTKHTHI